MNKINKIIKLFVVLMFVLLFSGCDNEVPVETFEPTASFIEEKIVESLKNNEMLSFDKVSDFKFERVDVSESDMDTLVNKFASRVEYIKYNATFEIISVSMDIKANYSAVFVYNSGKWDLSFGYITDKNLWEYEEKDASRVDKQRMLADLKTIDFTNFEKGYVGNIKYSSLGNISNREYNENVHRDVIDIVVNVKTNFAEYEIPIQMIYYFNRGEWVLGDVKISDTSEWLLTYDSGEAPEEIGTDVILEYLTTESYFLTYVCNKDYIDNIDIEKISEIASVDAISTIYEVYTEYEKIGTITYYVDVSYQWLNQEWSDIKVAVKDEVSADFSSLINREFFNYENEKDRQGIVFTSVTEKESGVYSIEGNFFNPLDSSSVETFKGELDIPLRDNNWEIIIKIDGQSDNTIILILDLSNQSILQDGKVYKNY